MIHGSTVGIVKKMRLAVGKPWLFLIPGYTSRLEAHGANYSTTEAYRLYKIT